VMRSLISEPSSAELEKGGEVVVIAVWESPGLRAASSAHGFYTSDGAVSQLHGTVSRARGRRGRSPGLQPEKTAM
jgi:hypothetical protein